MTFNDKSFGNDADAQGMTFVIPIVHPDGNKISDYEVVERILAETVTSIITADGSARVVVVCHRLPKWRAQFDERVVFLILADHWGFAAGRNDVCFDKGLKYCVGIWFALADHNPELIVPFDGDDFIRHDFIWSTSSQLAKLPRKDGLLIKGGYNIALAPCSKGFTLKAALKVRDFDLTCGSCRVLRASKLEQDILRISPRLSAFDRSDVAAKAGMLEPEFLDTLVKDAGTISNDDAELIQVLGRHLNQEVFFDLAPSALDIVAKGCGHGNHDGPRAGEVHWHRLKGLTPNRRFLALFGLQKRETMRSKASLVYQIRGLGALFRQPVRSATRKIKRLLRLSIR